MRGSSGQLLSHLPAIYQDSEDLRQVLSIFESVLLDSGEKVRQDSEGTNKRSGNKAIAESIAAIATLFDPLETRREFLPWLSRWVALTLASGLPEERQRRLLAAIVPLYAIRGTRDYLVKLLKFFLPDDVTPEIDEEGGTGFKVGSARVGIDTSFGADKPFWFTVRIPFMPYESEYGSRPEHRDRLEEQIRQVIEHAKPAHTLYELIFEDSEANAYI